MLRPTPRNPNACFACKKRKKRCVVREDQASYHPEQIRVPIKHRLPERMSSTKDVHQTTSLDFYKSVLMEFLGPAHSLRSAQNSGGNSAANGPNVVETQPRDPEPRIFDLPALQNSAPEDYQYLYNKGCLTLPPLSLRNQLLQAYIKWIHPLLPLLDVSGFLQEVLLHDDRRFRSPLLYQSVMFAGSAFLDSDHILATGYSELIHLRQALFQNCKASYPFIQTQSLTLLTNWYSLPECKDPWYWLGLALSAAHRAGLHEEQDDPLEIPQSPALRRRVWWCLYIGDKIISLGVRKPTQIRQGHYNVRSPKAGDLDIDNIDYAALEYVLGPSVRILMPQSQCRPLLEMLYIEQVQLCHCISPILEHIYEGSWVPGASGRAYGASGLAYLPLRPKGVVHERTVRFCEDLLGSWITNLHPQTQSNILSLTPHTQMDDLETVSFLHYAYLGLVYRATVMTLYQPLMGLDIPPVGAQVFEPPSLGTRYPLHSIALQITTSLEFLQAVGLLSYLPGSSVTPMLFATAHHVKCRTSDDVEVRTQAQTACQASRNLAVQLLRTYPAAELVLLFISNSSAGPQ
ncbi:hypothetical protein FE257_005836 [Aspergillus nanangensis]|uniref:Xylanolytic transcriptional activator regulatory domain-containing protein n=1 Tax=Aspergillus nanangensis TaxID=2582783 RepID=A0AAD4CPT0_ASPNN|nr:hypothetical protein FE257_005836 [Aspergillus nanangensis]